MKDSSTTYFLSIFWVEKLSHHFSSNLGPVALNTGSFNCRLLAQTHGGWLQYSLRVSESNESF